MANASKEDIKALTAAINKLASSAGSGGGTGASDLPEVTANQEAMQAFAAAAKEAANQADRINALRKANAIIEADIADKMDSSVEKARRLEQIRNREMIATSKAQHNARIAVDLSEIGITQAREALALRELQLENNIKAVDAARDSGELSEEELANMEATLEVMNENLEAHRDTVVEMEKQRDLAREQAQALDKLSNSTNNVLGMLGLSATAFEDSIFHRILGEGGTGMAAGFDVLASTIGSALTPANLFAQLMTDIFDSTIQMVSAMDKAIAAFNKQTGAAGEMDAVMYEVHAEMGPFAGTLAESSAALSALYTDMASFSNLSKSTQKEMGVLVAQLERLGVNAGTSAKNMETLTMSLGMTGQEAGATLQELTLFADQINAPVSQVMENLQASMPVLAKYGKEGVSVFKNVEAAAKATGIATSDLIQITEQFDTFQSAAESVGRLNGILGGNYLNSLEMVNMSEDERIKKLLGVVQASGKNYESMSRHEKQALAAAAGIRDMDKANKLFSGGVAGYEQMLAAQTENADAAKRQEEMAKAAASAQEKYAAVMEQLSVAIQPIIEFLHSMLDAIMSLNQMTGGAFIPVLLGLIGVYKLVSMGQAVLTEGFLANAIASVKSTFAKLAEAKANGTLLATTNTMIAAYIRQHAAMLKAMGIAGAMVGAYMLISEFAGPLTAVLGALTVGMIAYAIANKSAMAGKAGLVLAVLALIAAFTEPNSPPFYLLVPMIAAGLIFMGIAAKMAAPGFLILAAVAKVAAIPIALLGVALLILGAGLALVGLGLSLIADAVVTLIGGFVELVTAMANVGPELMTLAIALPIIAVAGFAAMFGLIAFSLGMAALGLSLMLVSTDDLNALATMFEGMGKAAEGGGAGMASVTEFLDVLQEIADDIDEEKLAALSSLFFGLSYLGDIEAEGIDSMNTFFESLADLKTDEVYALADALWDVSYAMNNMPLFAPFVLTYMIESLSEIDPSASEALVEVRKVISVAGDIDDAKADSVEKVTDSIANMMAELNFGYFTDTQDIKDILESLAGVFGTATGTPAGGGAAGGENKIILALDREGQKRLAEAVVPHMESLISKKYSIAKVRS